MFALLVNCAWTVPNVDGEGPAGLTTQEKMSSLDVEDSSILKEEMEPRIDSITKGQVGFYGVLAKLLTGNVDWRSQFSSLFHSSRNCYISLQVSRRKRRHVGSVLQNVFQFIKHPTRRGTRGDATASPHWSEKTTDQLRLTTNVKQRRPFNVYQKRINKPYRLSTGTR